VLPRAEVAAPNAFGQLTLFLGGEQCAAPYLTQVGLQVPVDSDL
jgi:hypothetical protein